jgi:hypothetical protein
MEASLTFTIPRTERPIADMLSSIPRAFKDDAQKGFRILTQVAVADYAAIMSAVMTALESKTASLDGLEQRLRVPKSDLGALFAASMLVVSLLAEGGTPDEFLTASVQTDLMRPEMQPKIRPFLDNIVADRLVVKKALRRASMSSQVLPFLSDVEVVVDLRMAYEDNAVADAVPVAVFHIDTDGNGQEIWFQASKGQIERLKLDIDATLKKMEAAENWSKADREKPIL